MPPMKKILLIGCGPHAKTFYLPAVGRLGGSMGARIAAVVEVGEQREATEKHLALHLPDARQIYVPAFRGRMGRAVRSLLDSVVRETGIDAVIIATDPLAHKSYALWACKLGLHVLLDKPITTRINAVSDIRQARGIFDDYLEVSAAYEASFRSHGNAFIVCAHRRYHSGIGHVLNVIAEVSGKTGCPVTNIHSYHCDGQWRLPLEMVTQSHHSYFDGHGKVSHSGYHFLDGVARFWRAGEASGKAADAMEVISSFVRPRGLLRQMGRGDYMRIFGKEYAEVCGEDDSWLHHAFESHGEIDAEIGATFLSEGEPVALATVSLLHNGFSRRSWLRPGRDLYKGNGRVKHEQHRIHVGPFLCIQIHSYQAKDRHDACSAADSELGGNNHCEIYIFRNKEIVGGAAMEKLTATDLERGHGLSPDRLHIDQIKEGALVEFLQCLRKPFDRKHLRSDLADHALSARFMSAAYQSHARRIAGRNPLVLVKGL
jgi:hypothetical protein